MLYLPHDSVRNRIERRGAENEYDRYVGPLVFLEEDESHGIC
jgi:hypothetical protein